MQFDLPAFLARFGLAGGPVEAAAAQGVFIFLALLIVGALAILAWLLLSRARERRQRRAEAAARRTLLAAIRAEARAHWYDLERMGDLAQLRDQVIERTELGRWVQPPFTPIVPRQPGSVVFPALLDELAMLDPDMVPLAVAYYRQMTMTTQTAEDIRSDRYQTLPADQKIELVRGHFDLLNRLKGTILELNARFEDVLRLRNRRGKDTIMQAALERLGTRQPSPVQTAPQRVAPASPVVVENQHGATNLVSINQGGHANAPAPGH